jgi:HlyD family secretion protein
LGSQWGTFVVENGRARARRVDIGHRNEDVAEVRSGLREGEEVIVHPSDEIAGGVRVTK